MKTLTLLLLLLVSQVALASGGSFITGVISEYSNGNSGASATINWSNSPNQSITLTAAPAVLSASNAVNGRVYILRVIQGSGGSKTATWPGTWQWPGGTPPTLSTAAGAVDIVSLYCNATVCYASAGLNFQ